MGAAPQATEDDPLATLSAPMRRVLDEWRALGGALLAGHDAPTARKLPGLIEAARSLTAKLERPPPASRVSVTREDRAYTGPGGSQLLRLYRPDTATATSGTVLYLHGGGWVVGGVDRYEASAMALARKSGAVVAAAAYRQAPEHRFPAAHDDAWAAYQWLLSHAAEIGGDAKRVAVAGEDAGANLAANVSLRARAEGLPRPLHQVLIYPIAGVEMNNYSYNTFGKAVPFGKSTVEWYLKQYVTTADALRDKRLNLGNNDLKNLPRTTILTADVDPVMFEGKLLGHKMDAEGIPTHYQNFEGVLHDFFGLDAVLPEARKAQDAAAEQLEAAFRNAERGG